MTTTKHTPNHLKFGDTITCLTDCIDGQQAKGRSGRITGFIRFSAYHPREVMVEGVNGYLWERDVTRVVSA